MKNNFLLKKCNKCGAIVEVLKDCECDNCGIKCCGEQMQPVRENSVDASVEKHKPVYEVLGAYIKVDVCHVMESDHYIEWIAIDSDSVCAKKYFEAGQKAVAIFPYIKGSKILSYCNKHGLWSTIVE